MAWAAAAGAQPLVVTWDRNPESGITAYRVHIGTAPGRYSEMRDVPADQTSFVYADAEDGRRYYFAVSAQNGGSVWGPRSTEVSVVAVRAAASVSEMPPALAGVPATLATASSSAAPAEELATLEVVATALWPVSTIAVSTAVSGLLVEGGHVVRAFGVAGVQAAAALQLDDDARIESIALDPSFDRDGQVFLAVSRTRRDGGRELSLERHRYLAGSLGEALTLVPGLRGEESPTTIAVAADGRLAAVQSHAVLMFSADGRPVDSQAARPGATAWDEAGQSLVVAGWDTSHGLLVERLSRSPQPVQVSALAPGALEPDSPISVSSRGSSVQIAGASSDAVVVTDLSGAVSMRLPARIAAYGRPVALAAGPAGQWYVAVRQAAPAGSPSDTLLRVVARGGISTQIQP